jgi:hypothetical protein
MDEADLAIFPTGLYATLGAASAPMRAVDWAQLNEVSYRKIRI